MIYKAKTLVSCLLLLCVSCSGKGGTKIQSVSAESVVGSELSETVSASELFELQMYYSTDADRDIFDKYVAHIDELESYQESELIIETARFFLDRPYVASTLETEPEGLVVNLREFDCTTFVETVLALSCAVINNDRPAFEDFCKQLQNIRYRRGHIGNYTDRIHYFSDWIYENENRSHVKDVTKEIGGEPYKFKLNFMSSHPDSYRQLKSNSEYIEVMQKKEIEISERDIYSIITEAKIASCEDGIRDGDIVCFVTDIEGLDISHVGFLYRDKGIVTFIHASSSAKKVIVNPQSISAYVEKIKRNIGLMVVRPQFWN